MGLRSRYIPPRPAAPKKRTPATQRSDEASADVRQRMRKLAMDVQSDAFPHVDGWHNQVTRLGERMHDKRLFGRFRSDRIPDLEAEDIWRGDAMAGRAVEEVPNQILRAGIEVQIQQEPKDKEKKDALRQRKDRVRWMKSESGKRWWNKRIDSLDCTPILKERLRLRIKEDLASDVFPDESGTEASDQSKEMQEDVNEQLESLGVVEMVTDAMKAENGYGGAALFPIIRDGETDLSKPLNHDKIRSVDGLDVLTPIELIPFQWYADPTDLYFGRPQLYWMQRISIGNIGATARVPIHESRLITFPGLVVSRRQLREHWGWGDSILARMHETLRDFQAAHQGVAMLLQEGPTPILSIKGLAQSFASTESTLLAQRATAMQEGLSIARVAIIDAEEKYERMAMQVSGMADLLDRMANWLAAAIPMPISILMGEAPKGLNATGAMDIRAWYDSIDRIRRSKLKQRLRKLMMMLFYAQEGPTGGVVPDKWSFKWGHLWQPTEGEQAQARYVVAQADQIYILAGVLQAEEVAKSRFGGDEYSAETQLDPDIRKAHDEQTQQEAENEALAAQHSALGLTPPKPPPAVGIGGKAKKVPDKGGKPIPQPEGPPGSKPPGAKGGGGGGNGAGGPPTPKADANGDIVYNLDEWNEGDHPRDERGRFGAGGGDGKVAKVGLDEKKAPGWTSRLYSFGSDPGEKALGSWNLAPGNKTLGDGKSLPQILDEKGWVDGRDHIAKKLGLAKLEAGSPEGHEVVYRLSQKARDGLANHNGGNLEGVLQFAADYAEKGIEHGEVLTAYAVRMPEKFGSYSELTGGEHRGDAEWNEGDHPRDERGRFGEGGGGGEKEKPAGGGREHASVTTSRDKVANIQKMGNAAERKEALRQYVAEKTPQPPAEMVNKWVGQDEHPDDETWGKFMEGEKGSADAKVVDPARAELHEAIKEHYNEGAKPVPPDQQPVAIFNMGAPASGKGHMNRKFQDKNIVVIDPDEVKSKLPEYRDGVSSKLKSAAMNVHEESSTVAKQMREQAMADRKNFLFDGTGKNANQYVKAINDAKTAGYRVEVRAAYKDREKAREYQNNRAERSGRWVKTAEFESGHDITPRNFQKIAKSADRATLWFQHSGEKDISNVWEFSGQGKSETRHDPGFVSRYVDQHHQVDRRDLSQEEEEEEAEEEDPGREGEEDEDPSELRKARASELNQVPSPAAEHEPPPHGTPRMPPIPPEGPAPGVAGKPGGRSTGKVPPRGRKGKKTGAQEVAEAEARLTAGELQIPTTGDYRKGAGGKEPPPQPPVKARYAVPKDTSYKIPGPEVPVGKYQGPQSV